MFSMCIDFSVSSIYKLFLNSLEIFRRRRKKKTLLILRQDKLLLLLYVSKNKCEHCALIFCKFTKKSMYLFYYTLVIKKEQNLL